MNSKILHLLLVLFAGFSIALTIPISKREAEWDLSLDDEQEEALKRDKALTNSSDEDGYATAVKQLYEEIQSFSRYWDKAEQNPESFSDKTETGDLREAGQSSNEPKEQEAESYARAVQNFHDELEDFSKKWEQTSSTDSFPDEVETEDFLTEEEKASDSKEEQQEKQYEQSSDNSYNSNIGVASKSDDKDRLLSVLKSIRELLGMPRRETTRK